VPNYANILQASQTGKTAGYKPALYFSEVADITTWSRPTAAGTTIGDTLLISVAHTWAVGKAVNKWELAAGSVRSTSDVQGPEGAKIPVYTATMRLVGDNAATLEQLVRSLNDQKVVWFKDANCLTANDFVQLGDDCNPVTVTFAFDSKTNSTETVEGSKEYTITISSRAKFFYAAALDETV
jgi:hypothetical protein